MESATMKVVVQKANIPLASGESIDSFTAKLSDQGRAHCFKKMNLDKTRDSVYMVEAFGNGAVFQVYKHSATPMVQKYFATKYERDVKTGEFEFGEFTEVERVVGYKPVGPIPLTKNEEVETTQKAAIPPVIPGRVSPRLPGATCPFCGGGVSRGANECPHCNRQLVLASKIKKCGCDGTPGWVEKARPLWEGVL